MPSSCLVFTYGGLEIENIIIGTWHGKSDHVLSKLEYIMKENNCLRKRNVITVSKFECYTLLKMLSFVSVFSCITLKN